MFLRLNPALKARSPQDERRHNSNLNPSLNPLRNVPRRHGHLPSLYPDIAQSSYSNYRHENNDGNVTRSQNRDGYASDESRLSTSRGDTSCQNYIESSRSSGLRIKGTPLILGATTVLRAGAAAVGVGSDVASTAVQNVEENIETPESEVRRLDLYIIIGYMLNSCYYYRYSMELLKLFFTLYKTN